jgi:biopolymer transport protein TolQ
MESGLPTLAIIASSTPFIGLLGTVIGIMNSFRDIAAKGETNLTVVAPGIAEALFATALGLFAAIPALIFLQQVLERHLGLLRAHGELRAEVSVRLSRRLHERRDA